MRVLVGLVLVIVALAVAGVEVRGELTVGDAIVGLGTLALAGFTFLLATQTRQEVDWTRQSVEAAQQSATAAQRQAELSRESIDAQERPYVVATEKENERAIAFGGRRTGKSFVLAYAGRDPHDLGEEWLMLLRLWNIGKGPAIVDGLWLVDDDGDLLEPLGTELPIAASEHNDGTLAVDRRAPIVPGLRMRLRITYRDSSGRCYETTSSLEVTGSYVCLCANYRRREI